MYIKVLVRKFEYPEKVVVFLFDIHTNNLQVIIFQILNSFDFADQVLHLEKKRKFKNGED